MTVACARTSRFVSARASSSSSVPLIDSRMSWPRRFMSSGVMPPAIFKSGTPAPVRKARSSASDSSSLRASAGRGAAGAAGAADGARSAGGTGARAGGRSGGGADAAGFGAGRTTDLISPPPAADEGASSHERTTGLAFAGGCAPGGATGGVAGCGSARSCLAFGGRNAPESIGASSRCAGARG
jgi:hypothetical protein